MLMRIPFNQLTPDQRAVVERPGAFQDWKEWSAASSAGRRKKKEEKEEASEEFFWSSFIAQGWRRSLRGCAHRRQRQWLGCNAGFPGDVTPRAVLFVRRHA